MNARAANDAERCRSIDPQEPHGRCIRKAGHPGACQDERYWWGSIDAIGGEVLS